MKGLQIDPTSITMKILSYPIDSPRPVDEFTLEVSNKKNDFKPGLINLFIKTHAAGLRHKLTAEQFHDWMNEESEIPSQNHEAIRDAIYKMNGISIIQFRKGCGSSVRGLAHLAHQTKAYSDIFVHYVDSYFDNEDQPERFGRGYVGI